MNNEELLTKIKSYEDRILYLENELHRCSKLIVIKRFKRLFINIYFYKTS